MKNALHGMTLSLVLCAPAIAQEGPSYSETLQFLQSKLNTQSTQGSVRYSFSVSEAERCEIIASTKDTETARSNHWREIQTFIDLAQLDPASVRSSNNDTQIIAVSTGRKDTIRITQFASRAYSLDVGYPEYPDSDCNSQGCSFEELSPRAVLSGVLGPTSDNGPRVVRALRHLIEICGGREELF